MYLMVILSLHLLGAALMVLMLTSPLLWVSLCMLLLSGWWAGRKWWHSAAYFLDIRPDGKVFLGLQAASVLQVSLQDGGLLSAWLLVMRWQDTQGKTHATVVWRDSVSEKTFKLLYVWLRWQPQQHEVKSK